VFSSGHDLKELTDAQGRDYHAEVFQTCSEVSQGEGQQGEHGSWYCIKYRGSFLVSDKSLSTGSAHRKGGCRKLCSYW
jgi:hypothetical protein